MNCKLCITFVFMSLFAAVTSFRAVSSRVRGGVGLRPLSMSAAVKEIIVAKPTDDQMKTCKSWPEWGCGPSKFPWSYGDRETALLISGKCTVIPDDKSLPAVTLEAGDLVTFPAGMSCVWDVTEEISKHYNFG